MRRFFVYLVVLAGLAMIPGCSGGSSPSISFTIDTFTRKDTFRPQDAADVKDAGQDENDTTDLVVDTGHDILVDRQVDQEITLPDAGWDEKDASTDEVAVDGYDEDVAVDETATDDGGVIGVDVVPTEPICEQCDPANKPVFDKQCQQLTCDKVSCSWVVQNRTDGSVCNAFNGKQGRCLKGLCSFCINNGKCEPEFGENCVTCDKDCACTTNEVCDTKQHKCVPAGPSCGNGKCESGENCANCAKDCGCASGTVCYNDQCCTPKTCRDLAWQCGDGQDGCGGTISCGGCPAGQTCNNHNCQCIHHAVKACKNNELWWKDGCGNWEDKIKSCDSDQVCKGGQCVDNVITCEITWKCYINRNWNTTVKLQSNTCGDIQVRPMQEISCHRRSAQKESDKQNWKPPFHWRISGDGYVAQDLDIADKWDDYEIEHIHTVSSMLGAAVNGKSHAYAYWAGAVGNWNPYTSVTIAFKRSSIYLKNLNYEDYTFDSTQAEVSKVNQAIDDKDHPVLSVGIGATCKDSQCSAVWLRSITTTVKLRKNK